MSKTITKQTLVDDEITETRTYQAFTLPELKGAHPDGHQKALEKLAQEELEDYADMIDVVEEALVYDFQELGYDISYRERKSGIKDYNFEWDSYRRTFGFRGSANLRTLIDRYAQETKLAPATKKMLVRLLDEGALDPHEINITESNWYGMTAWEGIYFAGSSMDDPRAKERHETAIKAFEEWIQADLGEVCRKGMKMVNDEEEYHTSEEYLTEMAEANDWLFTAEGGRA